MPIRKWFSHCMAVCLSLIALSCGLPQVVLLESPKKLSRVHASDNPPGNPELPATVIAFSLPDDDTNIIGYSIYYKVYNGDSDPDYRGDEEYFDENYYIRTNSEMQPGSIIPNQFGFLKVGEFNESELKEYYIAQNGSQKAIYINFDPGGEGSTDSNRRENPIIGYDYPVTEENKIKILARGFIDPTTKDNKLRSFVSDWEFDESDEDDSNNDYTDGDLREGRDLLRKQPGRTIEIIESCGSPYSLSQGGKLIIRFVVYSYGRIVGSLHPITSKPIIFGDIEYSPLYDADRNRS